MLYLQKKSDRIRINISVRDIKKLNNLLFPGTRLYFLPSDFNQNNLDNGVGDAEMNLFLWSILSNRIEIAKIASHKLFSFINHH